MKLDLSILSLYFNHFRDICIFSCIVLKICKLPWDMYFFFFQNKISLNDIGHLRLLNPITLFTWKPPDISIESYYKCHLNSCSEWCFSIIHSDLRICWSPGFQVGLAHIVLCISLIWGYNLWHIWTDRINSII